MKAKKLNNLAFKNSQIEANTLGTQGAAKPSEPSSSTAELNQVKQDFVSHDANWNDPRHQLNGARAKLTRKLSEQKLGTEFSKTRLKKRFKEAKRPPNFFTVIAISLFQSAKSILQGLLWMGKTIASYFFFYPRHALIIGILATLIGALFVEGVKTQRELALKNVSDSAVQQIIDLSEYTRDFSAHGASIGHYQNVGAPRWAQEEGIRAVLYEARKKGLSLRHQSSLLATVEVESGFNPFAKAPTTTACGLFQFVKRTGEIYGLSQKDCTNPWKNAESGINHYIDNYNARVKSTVSDLSEAEKVFHTFERTYYLHHDGPNSSNPSLDVKATVLRGVDFLFAVHEILVAEEKNNLEADMSPKGFFKKMMSKASGLVDETVAHWSGVE